MSTILSGLNLKLWGEQDPCCPRQMKTHQVRVTSVLDRHDTDAVELTGGGTEVDVGAVVVVDRGLGAIVSVCSEEKMSTYSMA